VPFFKARAHAARARNELIRAISILGTAGCYFESLDLWVELISKQCYFGLQQSELEQLIQRFARCDTSSPPPGVVFGQVFRQLIATIKSAGAVIVAINNNDMQAQHFDIGEKFRSFIRCCQDLIETTHGSQDRSSARAASRSDAGDRPASPSPDPKSPLNLGLLPVVPSPPQPRDSARSDLREGLLDSREEKDIFVDPSDLKVLLSMLAGVIFDKLLQEAPQHTTRELLAAYESFREETRFDFLSLDAHQTHQILQAVLN